MDFTALYSSSSTVASPDGAYLLTSTGPHLVLRDSTSFQVLQSHRSPSNVTKPLTNLAFSPDSQYYLAADIDTGTVIVHGVSGSVDDKPAATIRAGSEGLQGVRWLDNDFGRRWLACWSRHGLRITIWNLENGRVLYIQSPKRSAAAGWSIKPLSKDYLAVLERHKSKDHIGVYDLENMTLVRHFALATNDAHDIAWSPCGKYIAVWESSLEYGLHVYTPDGRLLHSRTSSSLSSAPSQPSSSSAAAPSPSTCGLGIKDVQWHTTGHFLLIGGYDERVTILNDVSWTAVCEIDGIGIWNSASLTKKSGQRLCLHREPVNWLSQPHTAQSIVSFELSASPSTSIYSSPAGAVGSSSTSRSTKSSLQTPVRDLGIKHMACSPDGKFLAISTASAPRKILLVKFAKSNPVQRTRTGIKPRVLGCIQVNEDIAKLSWRPNRTVVNEDGSTEEEERQEGHLLAIVTGEKSLITWNEARSSGRRADGDDEDGPEEDGDSSEGDYGDLSPASADGAVRMVKPGITEAIGIPSKSPFSALNVTWSPNGDNMLIAGKDSFCCAYPLAPPSVA